MLANRRILDREIGLDKFKRLRLAQWVGFESPTCRLGKSTYRQRAHRVGIVEKNDIGTSIIRINSWSRLAPIWLTPCS